eukprot:COSAG01_NODE_70_length_28755_cov_34.709067_29_plen_82_part_00
MALDPHKALQCCYGVSALMVRKGARLREAFTPEPVHNGASGSYAPPQNGGGGGLLDIDGDGGASISDLGAASVAPCGNLSF